jgi:cytochrome c556
MEKGRPMKRFAFCALAVVIVLGGAAPSRAADERELVRMPPMMQEHMLGSMRDHLQVLNQILADMAAERYDDAAKVAEERLGLSSYDLHGAAHMAPYMPKGMQEAGNGLHRAASRFAIAARDMDVDRSYGRLTKLNGAMSEMTAACTACHAGYRIR